MLLENKENEEKGNIIYQEVVKTNRVEDQQNVELPSEEKGNLVKMKDDILESTNQAYENARDYLVQESAPYETETNE